MLPEIRNEEHLFSIPKFTVSNDDVKNFTNELKGFHEVFSDCFHRSALIVSRPAQNQGYPSPLQFPNEV